MGAFSAPNSEKGGDDYAICAIFLNAFEVIFLYKNEGNGYGFCSQKTS